MASREIPEMFLLMSPKARQKLEKWPRSAPARLSCRLRRHGERVAISAWCGVVAHVPGNATRQRADSHSPPLDRSGAKRHFCGTYACFAVWHRRTKSRVAVSSGRGEHAPRYPSAVCGGPDSRTGRVGPRRGLARRGRYTVKFLLVI